MISMQLPLSLRLLALTSDSQITQHVETLAGV
jgi:hypothetical protein